VDTIPLEPMIGWVSNLNTNIAEMLQEPTLMGAYEGAGITVLAKGLENTIRPTARRRPATVDEGNNWINLFYGPLSTLNPVTARGATGYNTPLGNYSVNAGPAGAEGAIPW
jgi:hypothetical protein